VFRARVTLLSAAAALVLVTSTVSCAPDPVTEQGGEVSNLYSIFMVFAAVIFVVTAGLIAWSLIRYRAKDGDDELPPQFHSNLKLEVVWFAIPQVIVIVLFVLSSMALSNVNEQQDDAEVVTVTGYQWGWRFEYEGGVAINGTPEAPADAVIPTGDVAFVLRSSDVVHSFWVPRFLIKRDAIPGRETRIDVHVEEPGTYTGVCAEFCGLLHDRMSFSISAVTPEEFDAWLKQR
jgi:cytochrome c oxidase subunit II